ncbi:MAG: LuxR C-terminal-related transcriptional regulator, partial [Eggerthella sp.]|nr:LuxR C-terminal-related transcriptional regulator [Eggerthella sp.]
EPVAADPESVVLERATRFAQSYGLTNRETEVLGYLARGRTLPYIADALFVTTGTVKTHTTHIYRKLDVNSRQELLDQLDAFG